MKKPDSKLLQLIEDPECIAHFKPDDWNLLVSQARFFELLPFVYNRISSIKAIHRVPEEIQLLLNGYVTRLEYQKKIYLWELEKIKKLSLESTIQVVVLKGMAYVLDELGIYESRSFADIDLLVAEPDFNIFEKRLTDHGWNFKQLNDYDENYYRQWSHASPPMNHVLSGIELDLHHHLSSPISDIKIDTERLLKEVVEVKSGTFYRLSDADIILHCANHFIYFDNVHGKFKDLLHIYYMLKQHSAEDIWGKLYQRAEVLGLTSSLYYMTKLLDHFFIMELPEKITKWINSPHQKTAKRAFVVYLLANCIVPRAMDSFKTKIMSTLLVVRYQWTRYPIKILLIHLLKKHLIHRVTQ